MMKIIIRLFICIWIVFNFINCSRSTKSSADVESTGIFNYDSSLNQSNIRDTSELILKADLMYANDQFVEAIELYNKLLTTDSLNGKFIYRKGFCLLRLLRYSESIECYLKSIDLDYRKYDSYKSLGVIYSIGLSDYPHAKKYFEKCLEIDPSSEEVKKFIKEINVKKEGIYEDI